MPQHAQPISELQHLSLTEAAGPPAAGDGLNNIEMFLNSAGAASTVDEAIKEAIDDFDISAL